MFHMEVQLCGKVTWVILEKSVWNYLVTDFCCCVIEFHVEDKGYVLEPQIDVMAYEWGPVSLYDDNY